MVKKRVYSSNKDIFSTHRSYPISMKDIYDGVFHHQLQTEIDQPFLTLTSTFIDHQRTSSEKTFYYRKHNLAVVARSQEPIT